MLRLGESAMHARLCMILALSLTVAATGCGRSDGDATHSEPLAREPAVVAPAPADEVPVPIAARNDALPAAFPHDIPIPAGLTAKSVVSEHAGSYAALFTGDLEPDAVYRFFSEQLVAEGWTIDKTQGVGPQFGLFARKDGRITTVISTRIDGLLHVELGVSGGL